MKELLKVTRLIGPHFIFWGWNLLFIATFYFGLLPLYFAELGVDAWHGNAPMSFVWVAILSLVVPPACTALAFIKFRNDGRALLALFYGVEVPLLVLAIGRLGLVQQFTAGTIFVFGVLITSAVVYLVGLLRTDGITPKFVVADSVGLVSAIYIATVLAFWVVPVAAAATAELFKFDWFSGFLRSIRYLDVRSAMFGTLAMSSVAVLLVLPVATTALYARRFIRSFVAASRAWGAGEAFFASLPMLVCLGVGYNWSVHQNERAVLEQLAEAPQTEAERRVLVDNAGEIQDDLLAVYLAEHRFFGDRESSTEIKHLYRKAFGMSSETNQWIQARYNDFISPFLYDGDLREDAQKAQALHAKYFDQPLVLAHQQAVIAANQYSWNAPTRASSLLDIGERRVHLVEQNIAVKEEGASAEIEIHEVLANQTYSRLEVFRYFTLPDSAVVTGLWLGLDPNKDRAFRFRVSTRGAAQAVYEAEVRRRVDPALLEQVGPRQYRLRVFPVLPKGQENTHVWLSYRTLSEDGYWPLPRLSEARNVYSDEDTLRRLNGQKVELRRAANVVGDRPWMPASPIAKSDVSVSRWQVDLTSEFGVLAVPSSAAIKPAGQQRFALIIDQSYSMHRHVAAVQRALTRLGSDPSWRTDVYLSGSPGRGQNMKVQTLESVEAADLMFLGGSSPRSTLVSFVAASKNREYDAVFFLTDGGTPTLVEDGELPPFSAPLYFVHANQEMAPAYADGVLQAIQASGGHTSPSFAAAFRHLGHRQEYGERFIGVSAQTVFLTAEGPSRLRPVPNLETIAARQMVRSAVRHLDPRDLATLDQIHGVAKTYEIVTPYSSFIVLVNERQHKALDEAEKGDGRFDREALNRMPGELPRGGLGLSPKTGLWMFVMLLGLVLVWRGRNRRNLA